MCHAWDPITGVYSLLNASLGTVEVRMNYLKEAKDKSRMVHLCFQIVIAL